jgi:hypothetical protein
MSKLTASNLQIARILLLMEDLRDEEGWPEHITKRSREIIQKVLQVGNRKALLIGLQDIPAELSSITNQQRIKKYLDSVKSETGLNYSEIFGNSQSLVKRILKRGKIKSEIEWRQLRSYLDELETKKDSEEAVFHVIFMLDAYYPKDASASKE